MKRKPINKETKIAAALWALSDLRDWAPFVPYPDAKQMTATQYLSLWEWHHVIPVSEGGDNHFTNLEPISRAAHKERTKTIDVPRIAKNKRVSAKHQAHLERKGRK